MVQRRCVQCVDILLIGWWWGKWESASDPIWDLLVSTIRLPSAWWGFSIFRTARDGCLCHLRGKQDLALKLHYCFFWLFLPSLPIPSLPWLAIVSAYSFELRESHEGWMKPSSGGHRKAFVPMSPAGSCSVSVPGKASCLKQGCSKENCTLLPSVWNNTACWLVGRIQ